MKIQSITLEDFQSYQKVTLPLHANFNCITGRNSSGKSAIVRAMAFLLYGQWDTTWVREGAKFCRITLTTENGTEVIREKGASINKYTLKIPGQTEQVYENFGINVPEPIEEVLQIRKAQVDAKEYINLNVSNQHDGLFLIPKAGSFKAKVIGKLSDVHLLDYSLREINKERKALTAEKRIKSSDQERLTEDLKGYEYIDDAKAKISKIENEIEQIKLIQDRLAKIKIIQARIQRWKQSHTELKERQKALDNFSEENIEKDMVKLASLETVAERMSGVESKIEKHTNYLDYVGKEEEKILNEYLTLLKETGTCPSCFTKIDDAKIATVKDNL